MKRRPGGLIFPPSRTPLAADDHVQRLAAELEPGGELLLVPRIRRLPLGNCYANVIGTVASSGGEPVFGWMFLCWPRLYVEAQYHAVWRQPDGELVDVTAGFPEDRSAHTLFLPTTRQRELAPRFSVPHVESRYSRIAGQDPLLDGYLDAYRRKHFATSQAELSRAMNDLAEGITKLQEREARRAARKPGKRRP